MTDLVYWDDEFDARLKEVTAMTQRLPKLSGEDKRSTISACDKKLNQLKLTTRRTYTMELRQLDKSSRAKYQTKLDAYDAQIEKFENELKWANKEADDRTALLGSDVTVEMPSSRDDILKGAHGVQDQTDEALKRTLMSINEANDIGDAVINRLAEQSEQIKKIDDGLTNIRTELDLATDILKSFVKRMMTDKLIIIVVMVIIFGVIGVVIYLAVTKKKTL